MKNNYLKFILFFMGFLSQVYNLNAQPENKLTETFYSEGKIFVVIVVFSIVVIGVGIYLFFIDKKISKLEKQIGERSLEK